MAAATTPLAGYGGKVTYKIGAGSAITMAISKWTYKPKANLLDRPNTVDGRRRILGLADYEGTIEIQGLDTSGTADTDLVPGTICDIELYTDGTKKIPCVNSIIGDPELSEEIEGTYDATFPFYMQYGKTLPIGPA
jgi:hypothetical protein